jgi:hypothetical protein
LIYCDKWNFLHIPKTGGINFKVCATELNRGANPLTISKPIYPQKRHREVIQHNPPDYFIDLIDNLSPNWITLVRNPYSRMVSWYFFLKNRSNSLHAQTIRASNRWVNFDAFIRSNALKEISDKGEVWGHYRKEGIVCWEVHWCQSQWLESSKIRVRAFRLEDQLTEMEDYVGFASGTPISLKNTKYNASRHESWETYYTDELREIVFDRYQEDFNRFGYKK